MKESSSSSDKSAAEGLIASPARQPEDIADRLGDALLNARTPQGSKKLAAAIVAYADWCGGVHDEGCPEDDTCDCSGKWINDGITAAVNYLRAEVSSPARPARKSFTLAIDGDNDDRAAWMLEHEDWLRSMVVDSPSLNQASSPARPQLEQLLKAALEITELVTYEIFHEQLKNPSDYERAQYGVKQSRRRAIEKQLRTALAEGAVSAAPPALEQNKSEKIKKI